MAAINNLALTFLFFPFFSTTSAINFDLGGILDQVKDQVKEASGGLNVSSIGDLVNQATGVDVNDLGGILNQVKQGQGQGGLSLDTILSFLKKDENEKMNVADILGKFGYSVKDVLQMVGLGKNEHVATVAEQFITDPANLDKSGQVALCEGLEAILEEKPEVGSSLAMLGMDTTTVCVNR